jgi:alkanesulfonate monooxygenase SsuD/methylene tetrahydromethanopterin reductase-like flavin-dependent oxidoreductase (luciferase family)
VYVDLPLRALRVDEVAVAAREVEALGFDALAVTESTGNPFIAAALAATTTSHIRIATGIALALPRSPMDVAYTAWDLQALSGGRFALGLGSQVRAHVERRYGAAWERPAARMREHVLALRAIFDAWEQDAPLRFEGEFWAHTLMPAVERGLEASGRGRAAFEIVASVFIATTDEEWEAIRRRVAFYGSTPGYRHVLDHHGLGALFEALHRHSRVGDWAAMPALVDDDVLTLFAVRGTDPRAIATEVAARVGDVADRISLVGEQPDLTRWAPIGAALRDLGANG